MGRMRELQFRARMERKWGKFYASNQSKQGEGISSCLDVQMRHGWRRIFQMKIVADLLQFFSSLDECRK